LLIPRIFKLLKIKTNLQLNLLFNLLNLRSLLSNNNTAIEAQK
jgi:hypothetical protein